MQTRVPAGSAVAIQSLAGARGRRHLLQVEFGDGRVANHVIA